MVNPKKILVVEDDEDSRRILGYRLRNMGDFEILEASNGQQALDILRHTLPDLIFLDLRMPILDGWETARRIRAMEEPTRNVPMIALTAQAMPEDMENALAIGFNGYLTKPLFNVELIKEQLDRFLT